MSLILECTEHEAAQYIQEKLGVNVLPKKALEELEAQRLNSLVKQEIYDCTHSYMCNALADREGSEYRTAQPALDWLINSRHISPDILHMLPIGIIPELTRLQHLVGVRYKKKLKHWREKQQGPEPVNHIDTVFEYLKNTVRDSLYAGSVCFPLHVTPKEIGRLKFRVPHNNPAKDIKMPVDEFENLLGLFGLGWDLYYNFTEPGNSTNFAFVTEGEMDVLSVMAQFALQGQAKYPLYSVGGQGGSRHVEPILKSCGFTTVYMIGDTPSEHGDSIVQEWLQNVKELETRIFAGWSSFPSRKDIEQIVHNEGEEALSKALQEDFNKHFLMPWAWAFSRVQPELDALSKDNLRGIITRAAEHGKYLKHRLECEAYIDAVSEKYHIKANILKREIASREDNAGGFVMRCSDAIRDLFYPLGFENIGTGKVLTFFDENRNTYTKIKIDCEQSITQAIAPIAGTLCDFINEHVGFPSFLPNPDTADTEDPIRLRKATDAAIRFNLSEAVKSLSRGLPELAAYDKQYRQGYHAIASDVPNAPKNEYIVCGTRVFKIIRPDEETVMYEKLDGPSDSGTIFNLLGDTRAEGGETHIATPWFPGGITTRDLDAYKNVDIKELYEKLVHMYNAGFNLKHQEITVQLLATLALIFPISDVFHRPLMIFITGESHSGKSHLMSTYGGPSDIAMRMCYASQAISDYSIPGIAAYSHASSRVLILDEFEPEDKTKAILIREIFRTFRGLINGETTRLRARVGGLGGSSRFRMPIIFGAIHGAEQEADLNRLLIIETEKVEERTAPYLSIGQLYSNADLRQMSKSVCLGMYPHAKKLAQIEQEMYDNTQYIQTLLPHKMEWRLLSSFYPITAVMKLLGLDWQSFLIQYSTVNERLLSRAASVSESERMLGRIMHRPMLYQSSSGIFASPAQLLLNPDRRHELNISACGIHFDQEKSLLVFLVDQVLPRLLSEELRAGMTAQKLHTLLERHNSALTLPEIKRSNIINRVGPTMGAGVRIEDIVVLRANRWLTTGMQEEDPDYPNSQATKPATNESTTTEPIDDEDEDTTKKATDFDW